MRTRETAQPQSYRVDFRAAAEYGRFVADKFCTHAGYILHRVQVIMGTDGELSIEDFIVATMNQYRNLSDPVVSAMYRLMDTDDDGWVSAEDAFEALHPTGIHITVEELECLFDKYAVKRRIGQNAKECGMLLIFPAALCQICSVGVGHP